MTHSSAAPGDLPRDEAAQSSAVDQVLESLHGWSDFDADALDGQARDGQVLDGQVLDGQVLDGQVLDGHALDGQALDGQAVDGDHAAGDGAPARTLALLRENAQLRHALESRAVIEQAKGALVMRYGLDADRAFAVLRRWSQDRNIKLRTVAEALIAVSRGDRSDGFDPDLVRSLEESLKSRPEDPSP
jgi:hypothetical protein